MPSVSGLADGADCIEAKAKTEDGGEALASHTSTEDMPSIG